MTGLDELFKRDKVTVWDNEVPVIVNGTKIEAYLTDEIMEPGFYNELCYRLATAGKHDTVELHLNTPGGIIDSAFMITDAIKRCEAKVIAHLSGTVASAGTLITMACDEIEVSDHVSFMAHNYSGGIMGKGHEMKARQEFMDSSLNDAFKSFYAGFYTEKEMKEIIDGKDSWLGKEEVLKRWSSRQEYLRTGIIPSESTPTPRGRTKKVTK